MADTETRPNLSIEAPLTLPSGLVIPNRLAKAAMTEGLADPQNRATLRHVTLYRRWAEGGIGLQITGNVLVDPNHLEKPGNVVIHGPQSNMQKMALADYAKAAKSGGAPVLMQLSHAGRQTPISINPEPAAPSAVPLDLPGKFFGTPRAMTGEEIGALVEAFADAAAVAMQTGFDGVQVHAAHGYLISSFLNPLANRRTDAWGGSLDGRARLLCDVVTAIRARCGAGFTVSVKLNSSDFQKGGFSDEDCLAVVGKLNGLGVDLLEVSGGSYEQPKMMGNEGMKPAYEVRESTRKREAYFLDYAKAVKAEATMPVMVTGGFRSRAAMDEALAAGEADVVGLARPLCVDTGLPAALLSGETAEADRWEQTLRLGPTKLLGPTSPIGLVKALNGFGIQAWFCEQLYRMADGHEPNRTLGVFTAFQKGQAHDKRAAKAMIAARGGG
ncbi:MAG: NADH:flavin oxidoreductase/NADH oxidase family protein [Pseudomonadota bacterium]